MKLLSAEFIKSSVSPEQFPPDRLPEIAFVGRSNVGKSSLINSLLHRKKLAKVSKTPGKTRAVNFFTVRTSDPKLSLLSLVDLPGYGYAKVSKTMRAQWGPMIEQYLETATVPRGCDSVDRGTCVDAAGCDDGTVGPVSGVRHDHRPDESR
jgi:GTP-binding protein